MIVAIPLALAVIDCQSVQAAGHGKLDQLFERLADPEERDWKIIEQEIRRLWAQSGSPTADLLLKRGSEAMRRGDYDSALAHLTALVDSAPDFAEGWNRRATLFYLTQRFSLSVSDIERTLALEPRHFGAMSGLATIFIRLGRPEQALAVYEHLLTIHPHQPSIHEAIRRLREQVEGTGI
ncbi:MAG: tetratricopeptide repeat protein [Paracoccaceae bacterium]|nr:tetratricopeptide repeat protein [Paracoccaceae bacterium]MDE2915411.1 tetratricopeptide repeat protein [Paracoccaceae bacterium]